LRWSNAPRPSRQLEFGRLPADAPVQRAVPLVSRLAPHLTYHRFAKTEEVALQGGWIVNLMFLATSREGVAIAFR
jgi:hypothetical protein